LIGADLLILVTDQNGLYTADPNKDPQAELIRVIDTPEIPESIREAAGGSVSGLGTGGMATKVHAADIARRLGTAVLIVNGQEPDIIIKAAEGQELGTLFKPVNTVLESRKRFILADFHGGTNAVIIDEGAAKALQNGKSLLPAGIKSFTGDFVRGDTIRILDTDQHEVGVGVTNYSADNLRLMNGCRASQIETILGYTYGDEVIHHDFMILN
jgi:glutamate 5-kinase